VATLTPDSVSELRERLATDGEFFLRQCAKIIDKQRRLVPFDPNLEQVRFIKALEGQRARGEPQRAIICKARQIGFSTVTQGLLIQRTTQHANQRALVVAQDKDTAGSLFQIGELMYQHLPPSEELAIKPRIANRGRRKELYFGEPSRDERDAGNIGINSRYTVDTANEAEAGRGQTYTAIHASEVAFWVDIETKLLGLLSAVPNDPETLVVLESTANGNNFFRDLWDQAVDGQNGYIPFFSAWHDDPGYRRPFLDAEDRADFEGQVGEGPYGEDEPMLQERFGLDLEQLHWRRWKLDQPDMGGDLRKFRQEYPSYADEAFISTGHQVFDQRRVQTIVNRCLTVTDQLAEEGILRASGTTMRRGRHGMVEVPTGAEWVARADSGLGARYPFWRVWEQPSEEGRYIVVADPAEGEEVERGESDFHGIQVIDHVTRKHVARYRSRIDPDLAGDQVYFAALHWNQALIVVEKTGGYGMAMLRRIYFDYKYPRNLVYFRRAPESSRDREDDRLGWSTDRATKPIIVTTMTQVLREATDPGGDLDVVRDLETANELTSFMRDERGRTGARKGRHDDLLMPLMVGHEVATQVRPRPARKGSGTVSMLSQATRDRWSIR
jgi:hypothetical protein